MKRFFAKVYSEDGTTLLGVLNDVVDISFRKKINGGLGELTIRLPRRIDNFGEGDLIDFVHRVEIVVADIDAPSGVVIYSGYIDTYSPVVTGNTEYVDVQVLGYTAQLQEQLYKNGTDVTMAFTSTNVDVIFKDIIDRNLAENSTLPIPIAYTTSPSSVDTGGGNISYSFNSLTCMEALDRLIDFSAAGFFWYVGADNIAHFKNKPTTATHSFIYGRHILGDFGLVKSIRDHKNRVLFWNSASITRIYTNSSTGDPPKYWRRFEKLNDSRITDETYSRALAREFLRNRSGINHGIRFLVVDNNYSEFGYDIESIEAGHTCRILNVKDSQVFSDNMLITGVKYNLDSVELEVEDLEALTSRNLTNIRRTLNDRYYQAGQGDVTFTDVT